MNIVDEVFQNNEGVDRDTEEIKELKKRFIENLFLQVGTVINPKIQCTNVMLAKVFDKLYNKYHYKCSHYEFMVECMYWSYDCLRSFKIKGNGSWSKVLDGSDKDTINLLEIYIQKGVEKRIYEHLVNSDKKFTTGTYKGEKNQKIMKKQKMVSLNEKNEEEKEWIEIVAGDQSFFSENCGNILNVFYSWYLRNKTTILTAKQYEYVNLLEKCSHEPTDLYTVNDHDKVTGRSGKNKSRQFEGIKDRVLRHWLKAYPLGEITLLEIRRLMEINLWSQLIDLVYCDEIDLNQQNLLISRWIVNNLDNDFVANLIYDNLSGNEAKYVVYAYHNHNTVIHSKILYKIVGLVEAKLEQLRQFDTSIVSFYKKEEEIGEWTNERFKELKKYKKEFIETTTFVYDLEGNFLREMKYVPAKVPKVVELQTNGIEYAIENY